MLPLKVSAHLLFLLPGPSSCKIPLRYIIDTISHICPAGLNGNFWDCKLESISPSNCFCLVFGQREKKTNWKHGARAMLLIASPGPDRGVLGLWSWFVWGMWKSLETRAREALKCCKQRMMVYTSRWGYLLLFSSMAHRFSLSLAFNGIGSSQLWWACVSLPLSRFWSVKNE